MARVVKPPVWLDPGKIVCFKETQTYGVVRKTEGLLVWVDWMFGNNLLGATDDEVRRYRSVVGFNEVVEATPPYPEHLEIYINALRLRGLV